jgi:hypothetical protein
MSINDLFEDGILNLPLERNGDFRPFIKKLFSDFITKVDSLQLSTFFPDKDKDKIKILVKGIQQCIDTYLDGRPTKAYQRLVKSFNDSGVAIEILLKDNDLGKRSLYRLRIQDKNGGYRLNKDELFHIPFHKRDLIKTQRFSIPGYPCLYLANSIYVAWEEMRRPELTKLHSVRLQTQRNIKYLDLCNTFYQKNFDRTNMDEPALLRHLLAWPLIAVCSVKVPDSDAAFKPEYIIPQMVLQWVKNEKKHEAIRFSSTHIDQNRTQTFGEFFNLVMPVITDSDNGHCPEIQKIFTSTEVLSWQLYQASSGGPNGTNWGVSHSINDDVKGIEFISGVLTPYEQSSLASLEHQLNSMILTRF